MHGDAICPTKDQRGVLSNNSCTIGAAEAGFLITTTALPKPEAGSTYGPFVLTTQDVAPSTSPYQTVVRWSVDLPSWLTLTAAGSLSGSPPTNGAIGNSIAVRAVETVKTVTGDAKIKTTTTVRATIPFVEASTPSSLEIVPSISQFPTLTIGESPYPPIPNQASSCTDTFGIADLAHVVGGVPPYFGEVSVPQVAFSHLGIGVRIYTNDYNDMEFVSGEGGAVIVTGTPGGEPVQNAEVTVNVIDATGAMASVTFPWTIDNPEEFGTCYTGG